MGKAFEILKHTCSLLVDEYEGGNALLSQEGNWSGTVSHISDPRRDGQTVCYAHERLFAPKQITNVLIQTGYTIGRMEFMGFMPAPLIRSHKMLKLLSKCGYRIRNKKISSLFSKSYQIVNGMTKVGNYSDF